MSMDDILKVLVESRQQGGSTGTSKGSDPMTDLIGGLLGGGGSGGSSDLMSGMLGSLLGGGQPQTSNQGQDPMSSMLGSLLGGGEQPQSSNQGSGSMSDVLGGLMGGQAQTGGQQQDAMSGMLGSLMGGGGNQQAGGLGTIMSLLEMVTGSGQQTGLAQSSLGGSNNPIMSLVQPFITPLANKLKISPQLAMIVVSFVLQKLLAHHPTSGRDSTQFDLDQMLNQLNTGKLDPNLIKNSGMVQELSQVTGMNQAMAAKSLNTAFTMVGKRALTVAGTPPARKASGGVKRA